MISSLIDSIGLQAFRRASNPFKKILILVIWIVVSALLVVGLVATTL